MYVYRYQHKVNGRGPYQFGFLQWQTRSHTLSDHPAAWEDGIPNDDWDRKHVFGFVSTGHLTDWFNKEERRGLKRAGFICIRVDVPIDEILFGYKQVIFPWKYTN